MYDGNKKEIFRKRQSTSRNLFESSIINPISPITLEQPGKNLQDFAETNNCNVSPPLPPSIHKTREARSARSESWTGEPHQTERGKKSLVPRDRVES